MKTLTVTEARKNLSQWLRRAKAGEEIGIIDGADIVALRLVRVTALDYMETEYGLTKEEGDQAAARVVAEAAEDRRKGKMIPLDDIPLHAPRRAYSQGRGRA